MAHTLTRTDQVLDVLKAGGQVQASADARLLRLVDSTGKVVAAWQTAIKAAAKKLGLIPATGEALEWIQTAREDIARGDLVDAMDSLLVAHRCLQTARQQALAAAASRGG